AAPPAVRGRREVLFVGEERQRRRAEEEHERERRRATVVTGVSGSGAERSGTSSLRVRCVPGSAGTRTGVGVRSATTGTARPVGGSAGLDPVLLGSDPTGDGAVETSPPPCRRRRAGRRTGSG